MKTFAESVNDPFVKIINKVVSAKNRDMDSDNQWEVGTATVIADIDYDRATRKPFIELTLSTRKNWREGGAKATSERNKKLIYDKIRPYLASAAVSELDAYLKKEG